VAALQGFKASHPAGRWERLVLAGKKTVSHYVHLAVERQQYDLQHGAERGLRFDAKEAQRVINFFERHLHHWKGEWAGQVVHLEPWQQWMLGVLFGWKGEDGFRRFRRLWMEVARKNGKSFIAAGIGRAPKSSRLQRSASRSQSTFGKTPA
jgi:phage terminase large subunit-like protein